MFTDNIGNQMVRVFEIKQIGTIYSPYKKKALDTIESFSHIMLFYIFHQAGEVKLSRPTFLDNTPHGVFASRHPCRPNGIGFSIVRLESRTGTNLEVSAIDVLDNTPLIDVKPYIPRFDHQSGASNGWTETLLLRDKPPGRE
jgi:tRNA-Thr(GGU) m(6)t(6)A37 methyltransferase TsaA